MRKFAFALALLLVSTPAFAQFGGVSGVLNKAEKAKRAVDIRVSDQEERQIGQDVSQRLVNEFGVYQDPAVAKYVSLVGGVLAQASTRPGLDWQFIVLDTDGVNAFATPGGFVHITRGILGLIKNEAELAGVLGHEIVHITEKHTVNSIVRGEMIKMGSDEVSASGGLTQAVITRLGERTYFSVLNNNFDRGDEDESDAKGVELANKVGYAPASLSSVLTKLAERNKDRKEQNGLFASHPTIKDRINKIAKQIRDRKLTATATVEERYATNITFDAKPITALAVVDPGIRGLSGGEGEKGEKKEEPKKEEPKKGGLLSGLKLSGGKQAQNSETVASAGARGGWPDRDAVGGSNKTRVPVKVAPNDLAEFKKGIA